MFELEEEYLDPPTRNVKATIEHPEQAISFGKSGLYA